MNDETVFHVGQRVKCTGGYSWLLAEGKEYTAIRYEKGERVNGYQWPAYVTVTGDAGKPVTGHTHRFKAID